MRLRCVCGLAGGLPGAIALLASGPAWGSDHLMRINEVGLSAAGNPGAQYVELVDSAAEPFLATPYRVVVYSPAGARLGAQSLGGGLGTTGPYLVATAAADTLFGTTADTRLTVALPRPAGQLCFTRGLAETRIHCLAYGGSATLSSEGGSQNGPSPPDCRALERTGAGAYAIDGPTPNRPNSGSTSVCVTPGGVDAFAPRQRLRLPRRRDVDSVVLRVRLDEAADLTVSGFARIAGSSKRLRFRTVRKEVEANVLTRVVLRLRRSRRVAVKNAIENGKLVHARVRIKAEDARGNDSVTTRRIRLTD